MQLVWAGAITAQLAVWLVKTHNRTWRDVKEAVRKTRERYAREAR